MQQHAASHSEQDALQLAMHSLQPCNTAALLSANQRITCGSSLSMCILPVASGLEEPGWCLLTATPQASHPIRAATAGVQAAINGPLPAVAIIACAAPAAAAHTATRFTACAHPILQHHAAGACLCAENAHAACRKYSKHRRHYVSYLMAAFCIDWYWRRSMFHC
jgi:hypothetical protein